MEAPCQQQFLPVGVTTGNVAFQRRRGRFGSTQRRCRLLRQPVPRRRLKRCSLQTQRQKKITSRLFGCEVEQNTTQFSAFPGQQHMWGRVGPPRPLLRKWPISPGCRERHMFASTSRRPTKANTAGRSFGVYGRTCAGENVGMEAPQMTKKHPRLSNLGNRMGAPSGN